MKTQKFYLFLSVCNILLWLFVAARPDKESFEKITTNEFELVDKNGQQRVSIKVEPEGEVVFRMRDNTGTIRVKIGASENGSGLVLLDQHTNPGVHALAKENGASLTVTDKSGKKKEY
jgi:hypothetical protein